MTKKTTYHQLHQSLLTRRMHQTQRRLREDHENLNANDPTDTPVEAAMEAVYRTFDPLDTETEARRAQQKNRANQPTPEASPQPSNLPTPFSTRPSPLKK